MGKAKSCVGGFSIFNYVIDEKKGFELSRNGVCGETPLEIFQEFKILQDQNQKATNKLFSLVLSPTISDGERLTKKEFRDIVKDYLEDLGFDTTQDQFIAFCHLEKKHRHIHILLNRVGQNSKLKKDGYIGKKAQWAAHRVAERYGLVSAKQLMIDKIKEAEKNPEKPIKKKIYEKHLAVMESRPLNFKSYMAAMKDKGVFLLPTFTKKGELQGLKIKDNEFQEFFKASEIHKSMGLNSLLKAGLPLEEDQLIFPTLIESQKEALERASKIESDFPRQQQFIAEKENQENNQNKYFKR